MLRLVYIPICFKMSTKLVRRIQCRQFDFTNYKFCRFWCRPWSKAWSCISHEEFKCHIISATLVTLVPKATWKRSQVGFRFWLHITFSFFSIDNINDLPSSIYHTRILISNFLPKFYPRHVPSTISQQIFTFLISH